MKKTLISTALLAASLTTTVAMGGHRYTTDRGGFTDTAHVTAVEPIYRTVSVSHPRRECSHEEVYRPVRDDYRSGHSGDKALGMIVGGVLGGALGHNISRHHSDSAKVVGAVVGSAIGHEVASKKHRDHRRHYRPVYEERCQTVSDRHTEERLDGYRVTYRYHGQTFTTTMDHDPGRKIKVRVNVSPVH